MFAKITTMQYKILHLDFQDCFSNLSLFFSITIIQSSIDSTIYLISFILFLYHIRSYISLFIVLMVVEIFIHNFTLPKEQMQQQQKKTTNNTIRNSFIWNHQLYKKSQKTSDSK